MREYDDRYVVFLHEGVHPTSHENVEQAVGLARDERDGGGVYLVAEFEDSARDARPVYDASLRLYRRARLVEGFASSLEDLVGVPLALFDGRLVGRSARLLDDVYEDESFDIAEVRRDGSGGGSRVVGACDGYDDGSC
jgi:hypothetical protein